MSSFIEAAFPDLADTGYRVTSSATTEYNCIAWAAGDDTNWWWPDPFEDYYWPSPVPRIETLEAFVVAYRQLGYEPCSIADLEAGFEKVAIYVNNDGDPTHAARQLPSGEWTSKLGMLEDIVHHSLDGLNGSAYGRAKQFLRRPATG